MQAETSVCICVRTCVWLCVCTCVCVCVCVPDTQAVAEKEQIEEYIRSGRELFTAQANTVEDIGKAGQEARQMVDGLTDVLQVRVCVCVCVCHIPVSDDKPARTDPPMPRCPCPDARKQACVYMTMAP